MGWRLSAGWSRGSLALAAGALAGLALPPLGAPPLLWLALIPLWGAAAAPQPALAGALWGGAAVLVSHRWLLALHPLDWIGVPSALSLPLCLLLLALISALAAALVGGWAWLAARLDPWRWSSLLVLCGTWGLAERLLASGPLFWIGLGAAALPGDRPLAGLAQWLGGSGLAALQLAVGWACWRFWRSARRGPWLAGVLLALLLLHGLGGLALSRLPADGSPRQRVMVLQPAIPTRRKFEPRQRLWLVQQLQQALAMAPRAGADLLVLPEGALGLEPELSTPAPLEVISGGFRWQERGDRLEQRSALLRFAPGTLQPGSWLDKHRLVPLGEWVPLAQMVRWSGLSAVGGLEPGSPSRLLPRPAGAVAGAICYELSDGASLATAVRQGAGWLLASANLDPYPLQLQRQYAALAQLRAIETGRWLVSAANTGPSLLVDPAGVVRQQLPMGLPQTAVFSLAPRSDLSGYVRWGDGPLLLLALLGLVWRWRQARRRAPQG